MGTLARVFPALEALKTSDTDRVELVNQTRRNCRATLPSRRTQMLAASPADEAAFSWTVHQRNYQRFLLVQ